PLKAPTPGILADFAVLPGAAVAAGETLARLTGPEVKAAMAKAQAAVESATARLASAQKTLAVLQPQLSAHLSTQQQVAQAKADVADARGALATAKADLEVANWTATIRAPVAGAVLAVNAAPGERVAAGDTLLTLEPANGLWVTAVLYGADAQSVRTGGRGTFTPSNARATIQVEVASIAAAPDNGGVTVGMRAVDPKPDWRNGEYGKVALNGAEAHLAAVPTEALILDQGKWWVLVHTAQGDQPVEVIPGPARGWQTLLRRGPAVGTQIVAQNAYLEYHRQISSRYQPPD
ncbi:MAG: efflux RND transporter periplasmic adaptor subunit, partial [Solirubrobacteraceae bacterium]